MRGGGPNWEENSRGRDLDVSSRQQEGEERKRREWNEVEAIRKKAEEQDGPSSRKDAETHEVAAAAPVQCLIARISNVTEPHPLRVGMRSQHWG